VLQKFYGYWSGVGRGVVQVYTAFGRPFGVATNIMARVLFAAILIAIAIGFHRRRTLLLASPALISLPLFSLIAGSPRYMIYVTASIFIAGLPLIIDRRFLIAIRARRRIAAVIGAVVLVFFASFPLIRYYIVEKHPDFLLWAPIDPAQSTLYRLR
jgi:O-antigen ligase